MKAFGGFVIGTIIGLGGGAVGSYYYLKKKFAKKSDEEIESVKKCLKEYYEHPAVDEAEEASATINADSLTPPENRKTEEAYVDYGKQYRSPEVDRKLEAAKTVDEDSVNGDIYVISPDEFEASTLEANTLYVYNDNVVTDSDGRMVEDPRAVIGAAIAHIGEYLDDTVYVRNDKLNCDFEVIAINSSYSSRSTSEKIID